MKREKESVRRFSVGELCIHRGYICRVDEVKREITGYEGHPSREYMGIPDGTEFNPTLTLTPLYGLDDKPVHGAKTRKEASGAVRRIQEEVQDLKDGIAKAQRRLALIAGVS